MGQHFDDDDQHSLGQRFNVDDLNLCGAFCIHSKRCKWCGQGQKKIKKRKERQNKGGKPKLDTYPIMSM